MELLQDTHVWFLISFLAFVAIAWKFGKNAVLAMLDGRIEDIRKEIETAESLRIESQEMLAQYQRKHKDAVQHADEIISNAQKQANEIKKKAEADLVETMARREKQLQERLKRMEQSAIEDIRQYAANLSVTATAELIAQSLDKKANENLVDVSIKDISARLQ